MHKKRETIINNVKTKAQRENKRGTPIQLDHAQNSFTQVIG